MLRKYMFALAISVAFLPSMAIADEVVRWVDENGVTHFGNPQFAPAGEGQAVRVAPANGMDVPDTGVLGRQSASKNMNMTVLERPTMENPRGWRGYSARPQRKRH